MSRLTLKLLLGFGLSSCFLADTALADLEVIENAEGQQGLIVYKLQVTPAAEPVPALKHRLTLRPHELKPGNAPSHYVRVNAENTLPGVLRAIRDRFGEAYYDWLDIDEVSLGDLPMEEVREVDHWFDSIVENFLDPGSRCRNSDWGLSFEDLQGVETLTFLLPEFQGSRELARILSFRTRLRIADKHYADAIDHLRMSYRLAQDVGNEKILVCNLIGIAIEGIANKEMIELVSAPDSPNLYWALAELPQPVVNTRDAIRLEMGIAGRIFPAIHQPEQANHTPEYWAELLTQMLTDFQTVIGNDDMSILKPYRNDPQALPNRLTVAGLSLAAYPAAKQRLIDSGMSAEEVAAMPVGKVICSDAAREYRLVADSLEKWWYLPHQQVRANFSKASRASDRNEGGINLGRTLASVLLPAVTAVKNAEARMPWQRGALMTIEALRMHAAETGSLPSTLEEISVVPTPLNPQTLRPYQYHLDGETGILELPFSDGITGMSWRFEIDLAKE